MASGVWTVVIQGTGPYQNPDVNAIGYDIDKLTSGFVGKLLAQGHTIQAASFLTSQPNPVPVSTSVLQNNNGLY